MRSSWPAHVAVPVATVWADPDAPRPVDTLALGCHPDLRAWTARLGHDERLGLHGRVVTQALCGDSVLVDEERGAWAQVVVPGQPCSADPRGYPGWLPLEQLHPWVAEPDATRYLVVTRTVHTWWSEADRQVSSRLSFGTALYAPRSQPAVGSRAETRRTMVTRGGDRLQVNSQALVKADCGLEAGSELARTAVRFVGLPYLWGGASGFGLDCSGFVWLVLRRHGISAPRDAHDQANGGLPVSRDELLPGDLVFFADRHGLGAVHHVGMALDPTRMVHAPQTGRRIEVASLSDQSYASELTEGRRYR